MPDLSVYEELSLVAMDVDSIAWSGSVLRATYGDGYADEARVGNANGLHRWSISSTVLTDAASYGDLIDGVPTFEYYWDFFKRHTTGDRRVFLIEFRGRKYFAEFVETEMSAEMFTIDLFGNAGIEIRQRRVQGFQEGTDGSVFDPIYFPDKIWGWYKADAIEGVADGGSAFEWEELIVRDNNLEVATATYQTNEQNGMPIVRLDGIDDILEVIVPVSPTIYEAFFVLKVREATFSNDQGILSADLTTTAFVGFNGDNKLHNLLFGGTYSYRKNGVLLTEATQLTPMNTFGVIHGRWTNGITLANLQIGKDRDFAGRFAKIDIGEIVLCDALLSTADSAFMDAYLIRRWNIS